MNTHSEGWPAGVINGTGGRARRLLLCFALLLPLALAPAAQASGLSWPTSLQTTAQIQPAAQAAAAPGTTPIDTACWSASACVAVGEESTGSSGATYPLVVAINNGVEAGAEQTSVPSAPPPPTTEQAQLDSVSCQSSGFCVAVGEYQDSNGNQQAMVVTINDGVAGTPVEVPAPSGAPANPQASFDNVSCPATGACEAAGVYRTSVDGEGFVVSITGGAVGLAKEIPLPASATQLDQSLAVPAVSCWAAGSCVVVGAYLDSYGNDYPFVSDVASAGPSTATPVSLPADAHADDSSGLQSAALGAVGCADSGQCEAVGAYTNLSGTGSLPLVVPISSGTAGTTTSVQLPSDQITNTADQIAVLFAVSCPSAASCVAVGQYAVNPGASAAANTSYTVPLVVEISPTGVGTSYEAGLPAGAATVASPASGGGADAELYGVACPAAGSCLATGQYLSETGPTEPMNVAISAGVVQGATEIPLPTGYDASSPGVYSQADVACSPAGACLSMGAYAQASPDAAREGFLQSLQTPLAVATTSLPAAAVGSAYSQPLAATGAWGTYTWSVSSGSLPAGLSLDGATGVISGTPTAGGTSTFTVQATGAGAPVQTATQSLSLTVAGTIAPVLVPTASLQRVPSVALALADAKLRAPADAVKVTVFCSTASCTGRVTVVYRRRVLLRHGRHRLVSTVIASGGYSAAAGGSRVLKLALTAAGRSFLKAAPGHRLAVSLAATVTGGATVRRSVRVTEAASRTRTK